MNKELYIFFSDFASGPEATPKQQKLFAADTELAYESGYRFIQDKSGMLFCMKSPTELVEVEEVEEDEADESDSCYCKQLHNVLLVDGIINNTLSQEGTISSESIDSLIKLTFLRERLGEIYGY